MSVSETKTKVMHIDRNHGYAGNYINIGGMNVECVANFKYLGTILTRESRMGEDIQSRISTPNRCSFSWSKIIKSGNINRKTMPRMYHYIIRPIALYGCETWSMTKSLEDEL